MLGYVIAIAILVIAIVIALTIFAFYYRRFIECTTNPNISCFSDFGCPFSPQCPNDSANAKTCWPGVIALFEPILDICRYPSSGGLPTGCTCAWQGSAARCVEPV